MSGKPVWKVWVDQCPHQGKFEDSVILYIKPFLAVGIVTGLWAEQPKKRNSVPSRDKKLFSFLQYLDHLWSHPASCSLCAMPLSLEIKWLEHEGDHLLMIVDVYRCPSLSLSGDTCSAIFEHGSPFIHALLQQFTLAILC
jgi:hypothetical protein